MSIEAVFHVALAVLASLGGASAIVIAAAGWLGKVWANRLMQQDLARHNQELEKLRSELKQLEIEHQVRFARLHEKRAEVIALLYDRIYRFEGALQRLLFEYRHREVREDVDRQFDALMRADRQRVPGIHTLLPEESERIAAVSKALEEIYNVYGPNKLFLSAKACELVDQFANLAAFVAFNYQNVALKDSEGNLLVNPKVKKVWDAALGTIPQLLPQLELEFRTALGSWSESPNIRVEATR